MNVMTFFCNGEKRIKDWELSNTASLNIVYDYNDSAKHTTKKVNKQKKQIQKFPHIP